MTQDKPGFLDEMKRRHVWRVAAAYAVAAWLIVQVATQVFPFFNIPNGDVRLVVVLALIGFPIALVLAWVYEITPEGVRRTEPAGSAQVRPEHESRQIGRKLNTVIVAVLVAAVALMGWRLLALRHGEATPAFKAVAATSAPATAVPTASAPSGESTKPFNPPADTLVVLPFANLGGDPQQQYFSDGITEELTNALGQNTGLRVIAWDTASKYRDARQSASDIAKSLDVANVLTGKILRQGNEVRVIVELVNARTGYQAWSHHYDDSLSNIFKVQDTITAAIADALKVKFATVNTQRTVNPQAYELVLKARALIETAHTAAPIEQARALYEQAIALDPGYADAHAGLARAWFDLTQSSTLPLKDALPKVRAEANQALALDSHNVTALVVLGNADEAEGKRARARAEFQRALAFDPSDAVAHLDYGNMLPLEQALAQTQEAVKLDPRNASAQNNLAASELDLGDYVQALPPALALMKLAPHSADSALGLALVYSLLHRPEDAAKAFDLAQPDTELARALVAAGRLTYQSVLDPKLHAPALAAVYALRKRSDLDPTSMGDVIQLYDALGQDATGMELMPKYCAAIPVGCSDLSVNPEWLPLRGKLEFQALVKKYDTVSKPPASAASASAPSSP